MSPYGVWCLHEKLSRLKRQVGNVKSEIKTLLPDAVAGLEPSLSCTPTGISPSIRGPILCPEPFYPSGQKCQQIASARGRNEKEKEAGEEGRRKGSLGQQQRLFSFLWFCSGRAADVSPPYHSWTGVTPTAALMLTDYCLLALVRSVPPLCQLRSLRY